jgi:hypothetical protein
VRGARLILSVAVVWLCAAASASAAGHNITISNVPTSTGITATATSFTANADNAVLSRDALNTALISNSVLVDTTSAGGQTGTITVSDAVTWNTARALTLNASDDVIVNAPINNGINPASGLTLNAIGGGISQGVGGRITIGGPTTANAPAGGVDLNDAVPDNDFGLSFAVPAAPSGVAVHDGNSIALAGVNANSNLQVGASSVSQTAPLNIVGPIQIISPEPVQLNAANSFTGPVNVVGGANTTLNPSGNLTLGQIAAGTLDVTAGGALDEGNIVTAAQTTLTAPTSISLPEFTNNFTGPVSANTNGLLTLRDTNDLVLGTTSSNGAEIFSEGTMTQTGAISDGGFFEVQGDDGLTLTNPSNNFDDLSVSSEGAAAVRDEGSVNLRALEVTGAATVTAGNDLVVPDENTFYTAGAMTLVSDANAGSAVGPGGIDIAGDRAITSTGAPVRLFTAQRSQNSISAAATLNGATFTPGPEFADSATEVWNTAFPAGTATNPFTIFYKQAEPVVPPPPGPPAEPPTPDTTLNKTPKKKVKTKKRKVKVAFKFDSSVAGSTFACTLDRKESACSSPFKAKVKKGKHSFSVAASAAGKTDPTPATFKFKVKRKRKRH